MNAIDDLFALKGTSADGCGILNRNRMTVSSYIHTYENGGLGARKSSILRCSLLG
ncbi:hypothetical protein P7H19_08055 [Paenibacillus larvae]|nr:hypothetical protein [Paenibacillus larvae]MDT2236251.1 hypothetical protein [Paenibacillus larvae]